VEAVVWAGSGSAWPGVPWSDPLERRLSGLGWQVTVLPWGSPGTAHRGRRGVLHVFGGGMEPVGSSSADMRDRLDAVDAALATAASGECAVIGICLGAQMIGAVAAGRMPRAVARGGEAGLAVVRGHGRPDLVVPTAHVAEVPDDLLTLPEVQHLWSSEVTAVQGFTFGTGVVGVQFHPELSAREGRRAARCFRRSLGATPVWAPARAVDPDAALGTVLSAAGADRLVPRPDETVPAAV
jgi:GMP synthase-like glutamine amidotransferase